MNNSNYEEEELIHFSNNLIVDLFQSYGMFWYEDRGLFDNIEESNDKKQKSVPMEKFYEQTIFMSDKREKYIDRCSICIEDINHVEEVCLEINCGHIFHERCISKWFRRNQTCPTCRNKL